VKKQVVIATELGAGAPRIVEAGLWMAGKLGCRAVVVHADAQVALLGGMPHAVTPEELQRMRSHYG
jgi:hypothetical protein